MRPCLYRAFVIGLVSACGQDGFAQSTTRVSVDSAGSEVFARSGYPSLTPDGRYVAFMSYAQNLVPGDGNGVSDVFVPDRAAQTTTRVGLGPNGSEPDGHCIAILVESGPAISADGRYIAFNSLATNLVPGDTSGLWDVFVWDRVTATTSRVSVGTSGAQADSECLHPAISADGRYVGFSSPATTLVTGDQNLAFDVFVRDRDVDSNGIFDEPGGVETRRVSVSSTGIEGNYWSGAFCTNRNAISSNGRFVAFCGAASNLVLNDTNNCPDVFVHDLETRATERVSVSSAGVECDIDSGDPWLSADGRYVAFSSRASNLAPMPTPGGFSSVYVRDRLTGVTSFEHVNSAGTYGDGGATRGFISVDGRYVVFDSYSTNLVPNDTNGLNDVFRRDRQTGEIIRMSVSNDGREGIGPTAEALGMDVTPDANVVAFGSWFANLVPGDTNGLPDVFVREVVTGPLPMLSSVSIVAGDEAGNDWVRLFGSNLPSAGGTFVTFGAGTATLIESSPERITVRTPPGQGLVDVSLHHPRGVETLPAAFTYAPPHLAARYGNVNAGIGEREDVLLINAYQGDPIRREFTVAVGAPIRVTIAPASSRSTSLFAFFAWLGPPDAASRTQQPAGIGWAVFPTPINRGRAPQPVAVANNWDPRLGGPTIPSSPAPSIIVQRAGGFSRTLTATFQAVLEDDGSRSPAHASLSNAIILQVVPGP